ncbi:hypothetical protein ACI8B_200048 [Acinetobacter proteolyticus]|uniref:Uncharacterized protein n=1 Tax=Acinetobacter proteolyticus TaxID=1776741 RepID=A0A653K361_9GAMM|nr:hypothetical protein ACI8B_200048 [Acinetobacter proteolyticus]
MEPIRLCLQSFLNVHKKVYKAQSNLYASFALATQRICIDSIPISKRKKPHLKMQLFI